MTAAGRTIAERRLAIAALGLGAGVAARAVRRGRCSSEAGPRGYVLVRDTTCRLFGYHGLMAEGGRFSLDHMFGF